MVLLAVYEPMEVDALGDYGCRYRMQVCNPHSTHTNNMGLTGLAASASQCD